MVEILRQFELRLLRCSLPPPSKLSSSQSPSSSDHYLASSVHHVIGLIESGEYVDALSSDAAKLLFPDSGDLSQPPHLVYSDILDNRLNEFLNSGSDDDDKAYKLLLTLSISIAAFLCFTQRNITGPSNSLPSCPLPLEFVNEHLEEWEAWALRELTSDGSHLVGKLFNLQYLALALLLIMKVNDSLFEASAIHSKYELGTISWWIARILSVKQRILDEKSSSLFDQLQVRTANGLTLFGTIEKAKSYWNASLSDEEAVTIVTSIYLEAGVTQYIYGRVDSCRNYIRSAEEVAKLELFVTGALGYRTIHQQEPKAVKVLVAKTSLLSEENKNLHPYVHEETVDRNQRLNCEDNEIFITPKIENGRNDKFRIRDLEAIHQALILAQCLLIDSTSREDELRKWDMAPFIEAIDSYSSSYFTLRCFCDLMRVRWESTRSRTKLRALDTMSLLVEKIEKETPIVPLRIPFCYSVFFPTFPALQKEYGELLIACGMVGEAIKIFENLELWDNLIYCYSLLGKKTAAVGIIKNRLSSMPENPSLWCSLGDVTNDDSCYKKALEVSNDKSVRAKRALARSAYNRGDFSSSKALWESAMMMNSMYPDGWFALGAAALKARDVDKAVDAFTRAVQLDPSNGEAWNNLACLHMVRKKSKESFIAFKEALKLKRESWQMWENYSHVAMDVGDVRQALEATNMVLQLTNNKRVDVALLERLMEALLRQYSSPSDEISAAHFLEATGKILQQVVKNGGPAQVWGLYARWHKLKGDLPMCAEALLKLVRSYQGSDLWKDEQRFKKFAESVAELSDVYLLIGGRRELFSAEMLLKNSINQANCFSDTEEFGKLEVCLKQLQLRISS